MSLQFRPANPAGPGWNLAKTLLQTAVFWGGLLWLVPLLLLRAVAALNLSPVGLPLPVDIGWAVLAVASLGGLWSGATMAIQGAGTPLPLDTARELVVEGPYRFVRNPMAVFGIGQGVGVSIILSSAVVLAYAIAGAILWHVLVRPIEERDLQRRFGSAYEDYRRRVGLWVPRLR